MLLLSVASLGCGVSHLHPGFCRIRILAVLLGVFRILDEGDNPVILVSCLPSVPASRFSSFYICPHPSRTMRGGVRFEVPGWAAALAGVVLAVVLVFRGGFRSFRRPLAFVFVSAGRRRGRERGGGGPRSCPMIRRLHP